MLALRRSEDRGQADFGWLRAKHSFSFGQYYDPRFMGFRALRVINEDRVAGGGGFPTHGHEDMEIATIVLDGALEHEDSMGNGAVIRPGEVQVMSAGTGVRHSEFNASATDPVHLLQIWILPEKAGLPPRYDQKAFPREARLNRLETVLSNEPSGEAIKLWQDASVHLGALEPGRAVTYALKPGRHAWVQIAKGDGKINGEEVRQGDGVAVWKEDAVTIEAASDMDVVLFDLA